MLDLIQDNGIITGVVGGMLGGLTGIGALTKFIIRQVKAGKEMSEAVGAFRNFMAKYQKYFKDGEGKKDWRKLILEVDQAAEAQADAFAVFNKVKLMKKIEKKFRDFIVLED